MSLTLGHTLISTSESWQVEGNVYWYSCQVVLVTEKGFFASTRVSKMFQWVACPYLFLKEGRSLRKGSHSKLLAKWLIEIAVKQ